MKGIRSRAAGRKEAGQKARRRRVSFALRGATEERLQEDKQDELQ